jgi:hypothetical protein
VAAGPDRTAPKSQLAQLPPITVANCHSIKAKGLKPDRLSENGVGWAWYARGWDVALADRRVIYNTFGAVNFQPHHQP